jgi:hypothetical protein
VSREDGRGQASSLSKAARAAAWGEKDLGSCLVSDISNCDMGYSSSESDCFLK